MASLTAVEKQHISDAVRTVMANAKRPLRLFVVIDRALTPLNLPSDKWIKAAEHVQSLFRPGRDADLVAADLK